MRTLKLLSLINALAAATLLVVLAVTADTGDLRVTPAIVIEATKNTSAEAGLDILASGIEKSQQRVRLLRRLCYGSLSLLAVNAVCYAVWRERPAADQPTSAPD